MSIALYRATQAARLHLLDGETIERAAALASAEHGVSPAVVARFADEAHRACEAARHEIQTARPDGGLAVAFPEPCHLEQYPNDNR